MYPDRFSIPIQMVILKLPRHGKMVTILPLFHKHSQSPRFEPITHFDYLKPIFQFWRFKV